MAESKTDPFGNVVLSDHHFAAADSILSSGHTARRLVADMVRRLEYAGRERLGLLDRLSDARSDAEYWRDRCDHHKARAEAAERERDEAREQARFRELAQKETERECDEARAEIERLEALALERFKQRAAASRRADTAERERNEALERVRALAILLNSAEEQVQRLKRLKGEAPAP